MPSRAPVKYEPRRNVTCVTIDDTQSRGAARRAVERAQLAIIPRSVRSLVPDAREDLSVSEVSLTPTFNHSPLDTSADSIFAEAN